MAALFDRIDTFILRVSALDEAIAWYAGRLGLEAAYVDPDERLAVLPLPQGPGLTLWELKPGETPAAADAQGAYPIFATADAAAAHAELARRGVDVGELRRGEGVVFFQFRDADGNRLEVCQALEG